MGACWYLLSIEREEACWRSVCDMESLFCQYDYYDCDRVGETHRQTWFLSSNVTTLCKPDFKYYQFGIYGDALTFEVTIAPFFHKYFYCLWWGLRNLRSFNFYFLFLWHFNMLNHKNHYFLFLDNMKLKVLYIYI